MNKPAKITVRVITLSDVKRMDEYLPKELANQGKRQLREHLLSAYDSHKTTVLYEGKKETATEKEKVLSWKQSLLDLKTEAFKEENIPQSVKYFYKP